MEEKETLEQATARETFEETGVNLDAEHLILHTIVSLPSISEVYVTFRGVVASTDVVQGPECLDVAFLTEHEVPWGELAYPAMYGFLRMFFQELRDNAFDFHLSHVDPQGKSRRRYYLRAVGEKEYSAGTKNTMLNE